MKDIEETQQASLICQQEEELIWNTESKLSKICHTAEQNYSEFTKDKDSYELTEIHKTKENTDFAKFDELLSIICHMTLSHSRILDTFYT